MLVCDAVKTLLKEDQDLEIGVLINGFAGFKRVQRIATYKEDGKKMVIFIVSEPPAIVEDEDHV